MILIDKKFKKNYLEMMVDESLSSLYAMAQVLYDKKGMNILALDVRGVSSITDYVLIAEGNVDRHVTSMGNAVLEELSRLHVHVVRVEGLKTGDWVILDYGNIMVHLFMPGLRERYSLERLWESSKIVDLPILL